MWCAFFFFFNQSVHLSICGAPRKHYQIVGQNKLGIGALSDMALNRIKLPGGNVAEVITIWFSSLGFWIIRSLLTHQKQTSAVKGFTWCPLCTPIMTLPIHYIFSLAELHRWAAYVKQNRVDQTESETVRSRFPPSPAAPRKDISRHKRVLMNRRTLGSQGLWSLVAQLKNWKYQSPS